MIFRVRAGVRKCVGALAFAVVVGLWAAPAGAQSTIKGVTFDGGDGSYKRAVSDGLMFLVTNDPPYTFQDEATKEYDGIDVQVWREIAKRLGITKLSWQLVQFDALIPSLLARRADIVADNLHLNPKRLQVMAFTAPAYWYGPALVVGKGNPKAIHTSQDLAGKAVGVVRGSAAHQQMTARTDLADLKLYTTSEAAFSDVDAGRIDVTLDDGIKVGQYLKIHPGAGIEAATGFVPQAEDSGYAAYALRKEDVDLNNAASRALDEIRADGTLLKILTAFGYSARNLWSYPVTQ